MALGWPWGGYHPLVHPGHPIGCTCAESSIKPLCSVTALTLLLTACSRKSALRTKVLSGPMWPHFCPSMEIKMSSFPDVLSPGKTTQKVRGMDRLTETTLSRSDGLNGGNLNLCFGALFSLSSFLWPITVKGFQKSVPYRLY